MPRLVRLLATVCALLFSAVTLSLAVERESWTTSRLIGSPEPPPPFFLEPVWPELTFDTATEIIFAADGRCYVVERGGKIWSFDPALEKPTKHLAIDIAPMFPEADFFEVYGLAFHPKFPEVPYCFVRTRLTDQTDDGARVHRFEVEGTGNDVTFNPASEKTIVATRSGAHCGGNIAFGPDGYLYISLGDARAPSPPDPLMTGQDISDLESSILRIDIDQQTEDHPYAIPADNPFVDHEGARGEVWAYGLRNPWRISFRPGTNEIWCGDVGWDQWEMLFKVEKGGNYGWSITEGPQDVMPHQQPGPSPVQSPIVVHPHTEAASITGGHFYSSSRLLELKDAYLYSDFMTGTVWALWYDDNQVTKRDVLVNAGAHIISFGRDHYGEVYLADFGDKPLYRLAPNKNLITSVDEFPRQLSQTGLFHGPGLNETHTGVFSYDINVEQWRDGASSQRHVALPGQTSISGRQEHNGSGYRVRGEFPDGTALARTFLLPLANGQVRKMETQVLHLEGEQWRGYTYRWNDDQTDATLVPADGDWQEVSIPDSNSPNGIRNLGWRFHSRNECARCHSREAGSILGLTPGQLAGQDFLDNYHQQGILNDDFMSMGRNFTLAKLDDPEIDLTHKTRSWLHVNCAHCHRVGGGGAGAFALNIETPLDLAALLGARPQQGDFRLDDAQLIHPACPESSIILYRMAKSGSGHMPQLGASLVDDRALSLLWEWTRQLDTDISSDDDEMTDLAELKADLESTSGALKVMYNLNRAGLSPAQRRELIEVASAHDAPEIRSLFERFLSDEERGKTLGPAPDAQRILSLNGDAIRGAKVFAATQCANCHRINDQGQSIGPDLSAIGIRLTSEQLLDAILDPSKQIENDYITHTLLLEDGRVLTGIITEQTDSHLTLRNAKGELQQLDKSDIADQTPSTTSMMPEGLLSPLTPQQAADLIEYLSSLK